MKITTSRALVFIIVLWIIGAAIHNALKYNSEYSPGIVSSARAALSAPVTKEVVPASTVASWPNGMMPTKVIHIPEPFAPPPQLMGITLNQGDDLELDFGPCWMFKANPPNSLTSTEIAVNWGEGFKSEQEYVERRDQASGANALWMRTRIFRIRLAPGQPTMAFNLILQKRIPGVPFYWRH
jgi:hypothetical protein